jgi:hypothetical protein
MGEDVPIQSNTRKDLFFITNLTHLNLGDDDDKSR